MSSETEALNPREIKMDAYSDFDFARSTGSQIKVAIIDSGIDCSHPDIGTVKGGIGIHRRRDGEIIFDSDYRDEIGHGTACAGMIRNKAPDVELYAIKVLDGNLSTDAKRLTEAIRWTTDNGMNVANLSLGTTDRDNLRLLQDACDYASKKNVIIVAAEHNAGLESYPAVFPNVIGVTGGKVYDKYSYFYRPDHPIEFVARGDRQRLAWVNPRYVFIGGTSFAAPHITGLIALILEKHPSASFEQVKEILIANALEGEPELVRGEELYHPLEVPRQTKRSLPRPEGRKYSWIKKAALYPYNKEMHAFIRFRDLLEFEIVGVADPVGKGLVGRDAGEAIGIEPVGIQIQHSLQKAMGEADTLILGYVDQLGRIAKRDILGEMADKAIEQGKHLFSFVPLSEEKYPQLCQFVGEKGLRIAYPTLEDSHDAWSYANPQDIDVPVVGVFGTSSQQGKFTAQLALRRKLMKKGYKVGQIGTEPHCELLGFDLAFPNGYASIVHGSEQQHIWYLHGKMVELCQRRQPDIIIVGAQSGIIPYDFSSRRSYTLPSIAFLFGTKPDAYILTVNSIDPDEYIQDSVNALKALGKGKTILLTMSDKEKDIRSAYGASRVVPRQMSREEIKAKLNCLEDKFGIPATEVISEEGQERLASTVIEYFAEES